LITSISTNFINLTSEEIDAEINNALKMIGNSAASTGVMYFYCTKPAI